jgi:hypothetical protein
MIVSKCYFNLHFRDDLCWLTSSSLLAICISSYEMSVKVFAYLKLWWSDFFFFDSTEVCTCQTSALPLESCLQPFLFFNYFSGRGVSCFLPRLVLDCDAPIHPSHTAWITGTPQHACLISYNGVSLTFCTVWPWILILLIFTSKVAEITGVHHYFWPIQLCF